MTRKELRIFAVLLVFVLGSTEAFLIHNTLYTEGEVMQGLYQLLVGANIPILVLALWRPRAGLWSAVTLGGLLLPWQASENRKWAVIHEEVFSIVHHVDSRKGADGTYPSTLDGYTFHRPWIKERVSYRVTDGSYRISYFMDDSSIGYWYDPKGGFDYYPD